MPFLIQGQQLRRQLRESLRLVAEQLLFGDKAHVHILDPVIAPEGGGQNLGTSLRAKALHQPVQGPPVGDDPGNIKHHVLYHSCHSFL